MGTAPVNPITVTHPKAPASLRKTPTGCRPDQLFGHWACEPTRLAAMVDAVRDCDLTAVSAATRAESLNPPAPYSVSDGIAVIDISGPMTKYQTSFQSMLGGASTLEKRAALRNAVRNPQVKQILLRIDSPGGTVVGTWDLADAVRETDKRKPVYAYVEDMAGSAAYWVASQARRIYANPSAEVGSIGTFATLTDTSGAYAKEGVKVHVINAGKFKGAGVDGTPITDEQLDETKRRVEALNEIFISAVSSGRKIPMERTRELADGRMHVAQAAKDLGLIDAIASLDVAVQEIKMDESMAAQAAELATQTAENERLRAELADAKQAIDAAQAVLREQAAEKKLAEVKAKVAGLKNLPAMPELAEALVKIQAAAPDAFAVLERQLSAWNEQSKTAALFEEKGNSIPGATSVDVNNPKAFREAAQARVDEGKAKDVASAMKQILREQGGK